MRYSFECGIRRRSWFTAMALRLAAGQDLFYDVVTITEGQTGKYFRCARGAKSCRYDAGIGEFANARENTRRRLRILQPLRTGARWQISANPRGALRAPQSQWGLWDGPAHPTAKHGYRRLARLLQLVLGTEGGGSVLHLAGARWRRCCPVSVSPRSPCTRNATRRRVSVWLVCPPFLVPRENHVVFSLAGGRIGA